MQRLEIRLEVTEALLNHVSGSRAGIVGVYQRHHFSREKREALDAWARELQRIAQGPRDGEGYQLVTPDWRFSSPSSITIEGRALWRWTRAQLPHATMSS